jgi:flavorubredoxin
MRSFITALVERNYQNRTVGLIECGAWAPTAARVMKGMFEKSKDIRFCENSVTIKCAPDGRSRAELAALAGEIAL